MAIVSRVMKGGVPCFQFGCSARHAKGDAGGLPTRPASEAGQGDHPCPSPGARPQGVRRPGACCGERRARSTRTNCAPRGTAAEPSDVSPVSDGMCPFTPLSFIAHYRQAQATLFEGDTVAYRLRCIIRPDEADDDHRRIDRGRCARIRSPRARPRPNGQPNELATPPFSSRRRSSWSHRSRLLGRARRGAEAGLPVCSSGGSVGPQGPVRMVPDGSWKRRPQRARDSGEPHERATPHFSQTELPSAPTQASVRAFRSPQVCSAGTVDRHGPAPGCWIHGRVSA